MKLQIVLINDTEYYQWVRLGTEYPYVDTVGDIFSNWAEIPLEKIKLLEYKQKLQ